MKTERGEREVIRRVYYVLPSGALMAICLLLQGFVTYSFIGTMSEVVAALPPSPVDVAE